MNKTVKKVFLLIGLLVLIFLGWQIVFNDGGIVATAYNAIATGINNQWEKVAGDDERLLPLWENTAAGNDDMNGQGFDIETN